MDKTKLQKQLFKEVLGAMLDVKYCELSESEVIKVTAGALTSFSKVYTVQTIAFKKLK